MNKIRHSPEKLGSCEHFAILKIESFKTKSGIVILTIFSDFYTLIEKKSLTIPDPIWKWKIFGSEYVMAFPDYGVNKQLFLNG